MQNLYPSDGRSSSFLQVFIIFLAMLSPMKPFAAFDLPFPTFIHAFIQCSRID